MRIARVFPRETQATPKDHLAFVGMPPDDPPQVDVVHVSVAFTYDRSKAEQLAEAWRHVARVEIGGPAMGAEGGEFEPGMYLANGYVITSRGCPNRGKCWFCDVPKREGTIRELKIRDGWNVLDSNVLACSDAHVTEVMCMLMRMRQRGHRPEFTGGLEAARLKWWHVNLLTQVKPSQMFFAYDTPDDLEPLVEAGKKLRYADFTRRHMRCFVLMGYRNDTMEAARGRCLETWKAGFMPMAMLYRDRRGQTDPGWRKFQREWARPAITKRLVRETIFDRQITEGRR